MDTTLTAGPGIPPGLEAYFRMFQKIAGRDPNTAEIEHEQTRRQQAPYAGLPGILQPAAMREPSLHEAPTPLEARVLRQLADPELFGPDVTRGDQAKVAVKRFGEGVVGGAEGVANFFLSPLHLLGAATEHIFGPPPLTPQQRSNAPYAQPTAGPTVSQQLAGLNPVNMLSEPDAFRFLGGQAGMAGAGELAGLGMGEALRGADPAQARAERLAKRIGGATLDPAMLQPTERGGYAVADPATTRVIKPEENPTQVTQDWMQRRDVQHALRQPRAYIGTWRDPDTGAAEINVTNRLDDETAARQLGLRRGEKAIGQLAEGGDYLGGLDLRPTPALQAAAEPTPVTAYPPAARPESIVGPVVRYNGQETLATSHIEARLKAGLGPEVQGVEHGFRTSTGRFVDEDEAYRIAEEQDQLSTYGRNRIDTEKAAGENPTLDSSDLRSSGPLDNERGVIGPSQLPQAGAQLPDHPLFAQAVANTPGAEITDQGLRLRVTRRQLPEQAGEPSVRGGVFYLPEGSEQLRHYTGRNWYGGAQKIAGETVVQRPLFVKGATGGKAPERAFVQLRGKAALDALQADIHGLLQYPFDPQRNAFPGDVAAVLAKHGGDPDLAGQIVEHSRKGNTLRYAIQENVIAKHLRDAGYDAVVGYSQRRTGEPFISELYDVREDQYPSPGEPGSIHPDVAARNKTQGNTATKMLGLAAVASGGAIAGLGLMKNDEDRKNLIGALAGLGVGAALHARLGREGSVGSNILAEGLAREEAVAKMKQLSSEGVRAQMRPQPDGNFSIVKRGDVQQVAETALKPASVPAPLPIGRFGEATAGGFQSRLLTIVKQGKWPEKAMTPVEWYKRLKNIPGVPQAELDEVMESRLPPPKDTFLVYDRQGNEIDRLTYTSSAEVTAEDVKQGLVKHDGYDPSIEVRGATDEPQRLTAQDLADHIEANSPIQKLGRETLSGEGGHEITDHDIQQEADYLAEGEAEYHHDEALRNITGRDEALQALRTHLRRGFGSAGGDAVYDNITETLVPAGELDDWWKDYEEGVPDETLDYLKSLHQPYIQLRLPGIRREPSATFLTKLDQLVHSVERRQQDAVQEMKDAENPDYDWLNEQARERLLEDQENTTEDAKGNTEFSTYQRVDKEAPYREVLVTNPDLNDEHHGHFESVDNVQTHARGEIHGKTYLMFEAQSDLGQKGKGPSFFFPTDRWAQLSTGASLAQAAKEGLDYFAWATPEDRMRRANLHETAAHNTYGLAVPKAVERIFKWLDEPMTVERWHSNGGTTFPRVKLTQEMRAKILRAGVPALGLAAVSLGAASSPDDARRARLAQKIRGR